MRQPSSPTVLACLPGLDEDSPYKDRTELADLRLTRLTGPGIERQTDSANSGVGLRDPRWERRLFVVGHVVVSAPRASVQSKKTQRQEGMVGPAVGDVAQGNVSTTGRHAQRGDILDTRRALQSIGVRRDLPRAAAPGDAHPL